MSPGEFVNFATVLGDNIGTQVTNSVASTIADIFIQKYQSTGWNPTNILDYGVTDVSTPVNPLLIQPTDRLYYRIAAQNRG